MAMATSWCRKAFMTMHYTQHVPGKFGFVDFFVAKDASVIHLRWSGLPSTSVGTVVYREYPAVAVTSSHSKPAAKDRLAAATKAS